MSLLIDAARVAVALNALLLAVLLAIWGRNYLKLRTKHTVGLLVFAALLFLENAFALYFYSLDPTLSFWFNTQVPDVAWRALLLFHVLELFAIVAITWTTVD
ncbi:MAG: hypothetical protein BRD23_03100 [Halobacteriales archaeon SW_9_67_25]|jgi:hypothetical protein|nr:MAG: hypothetical protein BRD23_03100 [Halobacteriales archaeon SW_9_67_25]